MSFLRFFISIICGALASSVIGRIFVCVVAFVSPEFVSSLIGREVSASLVRYAAGVGMIWGYFSVPGDGVFARNDGRCSTSAYLSS